MNKSELSQYAEFHVVAVRGSKDILADLIQVDGQPYLTFPNPEKWEPMTAYRLSDSEIEAFSFDAGSRVIRSSIVLD
jgi:hypothetical protein